MAPRFEGSLLKIIIPCTSAWFLFHVCDLKSSHQSKADVFGVVKLIKRAPVDDNRNELLGI